MRTHPENRTGIKHDTMALGSHRIGFHAFRRWGLWFRHGWFERWMEELGYEPRELEMTLENGRMVLTPVPPDEGGDASGLEAVVSADPSE